MSNVKSPNGHGSTDPWGDRFGKARVETVVKFLNEESRLATTFGWTFRFVSEKNVIEATQLVDASAEGQIVLELGAQPIIECEKPPEQCKTCVFVALIDTILAIGDDALIDDPELEDAILAELKPLTEEEEKDVAGLLNIDVDVIRFNDRKTKLNLYPPWEDNSDLLN